ncbi:hypothetical protein DL991_32280 [Amycolatopsis sp. WAC 01375]|uniref:hypothetical protein n=1 Tax=unclassified Amycolatopsis TaxID=2618356 RepID=UPI000F7A91A1|nr:MULTISPECIES: hypothetical protein [unclassified Amycolatopsis]RSM72886.1 hypothetical protein DL991_32280 [Amycolatopsis sp. WAC 01375]RSN27235.1 hypothetical protein DL990_28930 [Amycolatopsis sp. WAC 01416]
MKNSGEAINASKLAKRAGVSRSWLYSQADLIAAVREISQHAQAPRSAPATDRSLQVRLQWRVTSLTEQNDQQRLQLERAYAEIRRLQAQAPGSITRS